MATLLLAGGSVALATDPSGPSTSSAAEEPGSTGPDTDNVQFEDQSGADDAAEAAGAESEGAADAAAQHADCLKVAIDDSVTPNVQYDDQTGACSLDTGGTDNGD